MNQQPPKQSSPSLVSGLIDTARNMFALVISRIELAAVEFSEIGSHLLKLLFASVLSIVALWFALAFWCGLLVVLTWDALGWKILLILAALFSIVAIGCSLYMRSVLRQGRLDLLPVTMAELRKDRDAIL